MPPILPPAAQPNPAAAPPIDLNAIMAAAGPPPVPASAGFAAWAADPRNSAPVANSIVKPGQPILPPNAAQVGLEAQGQPTHGPADPSLTPATAAPPPALTPPAATPTGAAPSLPSFDQWAKDNPHLVQQQHLANHPVLGAITGALIGAGAGLHGDVGAGANWVAGQQQRDREITDANVARYKATAIAPAQTQSVLDKNAATTNYTNQKPAIAAASIAQRDRATDQRADAAEGRRADTEALRGLRRIQDEDGNERIVVDRESPFYEHLLAQTSMNESTARKNNATTAQLPEKLALAERSASQRDRSLGIAAANVGLRREGLDFNKDKFYDPQPTGQERSKKDLANSAREALQTMASIRQAHPEKFGPVAGRVSYAESALGIQDPDIQRYNAAADIAKDHLTAVFGARSKYALEGTKAMFAAHMNNDAALASYADINKAIDNFQEAGETHDNRRTGPRSAPPSSRSVGRASARPPGKSSSSDPLGIR